MRAEVLPLKPKKLAASCFHFVLQGGNIWRAELTLFDSNKETTFFSLYSSDRVLESHGSPLPESKFSQVLTSFAMSL